MQLTITPKNILFSVMWSKLSQILRLARKGFKALVFALGLNALLYPNGGGHYNLVCGIDGDLSQPFPVGKGNVYILRGWCFHPTRRIRRLSVVAGTQRYRISNYGIVKPDVLDAHAGSVDRKGFSLNSGFFVTIPFAAITAPVSVPVKLQARVGMRRRLEVSLGNLHLVPHAETPSPAVVHPQTVPGTTPLVAICLATYNPAIPYFRIQIESLKAQTHTNWVCIINDDRSLDQRVAEMRDVIGDDERFIFSRNPRNLGFYYNFEAALAQVPPEAAYVALCDQDDEWYPTKLEKTLAEFTSPQVKLAYTDMDVVDSTGKVLHHTYFVGRKNNYTHFKSLVFANSVTGAATIFRAELLGDILPFPPKIGDSFHDHWIACVALLQGKIAFLNQPLYAYRQHGANAIGHLSYDSAKPKRSLRKRIRKALSKEFIQNFLWMGRDIYFNDVLRLVVVAKTLRLRVTKGVWRRRLMLNRFISFEHSLGNLLKESIQEFLFRRPTLGAEIYCFRGSLCNRVINRYYRIKRPLIYENKVAQQAALVLNVHTPEAEALPKNGGTIDVAKMGAVEVIRDKTRPLTLVVDAAEEKRVNIVIPTIDFKYLFGGYIGKLSLAIRLGEMGYRVRVVIVDWCDYQPDQWKRDIQQYGDLQQFFDFAEVSYHNDRTHPLVVSPDDAFIGTTWWTAHIAHRAAVTLGQEKFLYLIQEYEPMTFPMGSLFAMADETYNYPHYAIFSTELLREYFRENHMGVYQAGTLEGDKNSISFENAILRFPNLIQPRQPKKLLFYARPESHAARNMFEIGVEALVQALQQDAFAKGEWEFHGIGTVSKFRSVELLPGVPLYLQPRVTLEEYERLLPQYDVGLSLMLTPHPSLVPLEMAAAGMLVVTNTYANKTAPKLTALSSNLIPVAPTIAGVAAGLTEAAQVVTDLARRRDGATVRWASDWKTAFDDARMRWMADIIGPVTTSPVLVTQAEMKNVPVGQSSMREQ